MTDANRRYLEMGKFRCELMGRAFALLNTGTQASLIGATLFIMTIEDRQGLHCCEVRLISTDRYSTKTARPKYSVLSTAKIRKTFAVAVPRWQDGLERFLSQLSKEQPT